jgi:hypothetical protein
MCRQTIAAGQFCVAWLAAAKSSALRNELRPGGAVNGAIDTTTPKQGRVGGVYDCIDGQLGNIA